MMGFVFGIVSLLVVSLEWGSALPASRLHQIFESKTLNAHKISETQLSAIVEQEHAIESSVDRPYFVCGPAASIKDKGISLKDDDASISVRTAFIRKDVDSACLLSHMSSKTAWSLSAVDSDWFFHPLPAVLKVHQSVMNYFSKITSDENSDKVSIRKLSEGATLFIEYAPGVSMKTSSRILADDFLSKMNRRHRRLSESTAVITQSTPWTEIVTAVKSSHESQSDLGDMTGTGTSSSTTCALPESVIIQHLDSSVSFSNLRDVKPSCLVDMVNEAAADHSTLRVSLGSRPRVLNFEARGMLQSGHRYMEPYSNAGLSGDGQVIGIADSGLNDLSCFFIDDSEAYPTITTNRSGILEPLRRKVIQYTVEADFTDDQGGHGTHVSGTVAGSSSQMAMNNGMAPDAKIAFYDIGVTKEAYLIVPPMNSVLFPTAYKAGARVHTNSWGDLGSLYSPSAYDVDSFAYSNPDFLLIFAAGNSGQDGMETCGAPSIAKNSLAVGCEQVHNAETDVVRDVSTVSYFSSLGPSYDGRFKPDIVAPGDYIISAYAGVPEALSNAAHGEGLGASVGIGKVQETCSVIQMSGTSMATPATAGIALLIRQYFMQSKFWASLCNKAYRWCSSGAFEPSGYFLKAIILHSGEAVGQYSSPEYNDITKIPSRKLGPPPDSFQGYGALRLRNVLPLGDDEGLDSDLDLVVWDKLSLQDYQTLKWEIEMDDSSNAKALKITIVWYDPPGTMYASSNLLLHDIDLVVVGPSGQEYWGNKVQDGDSLNPNEQVYVASPSSDCQAASKKKCIFNVYVHAHILPEADSQNIAVIITTSGEVISGPEASHKKWLVPKEVDHTPSPSMAFQSFHVEVKGSVKGGDLLKQKLHVPVCSLLDWVDITLDFDPMGSVGTLPQDCQIIIEDARRHSVAMGGSDLSYPTASITTIWPTSWHTGGITKEGTFYASVGLRDTHLQSIGDWNVFVMNGWSKATNVSYHLRATLKFMAGGSTCAPTEYPTRRPTTTPSISSPPTVQPSSSSYSTLSYTIPKVWFGISEVNGTLRVPRMEIASFSYTGVLKGVGLELDGNKSLSYQGNYCHMFAVIITSPEGRKVQIGGNHDWFGVTDNFYRRNLPDTWYSKPSTGHPWTSYRDVTAGNIASFTSHGQWTVEIALGYNTRALKPILFSGSVTLYFDKTMMEKHDKEGVTTTSTPSDSPVEPPSAKKEPTPIPAAARVLLPSRTPSIEPVVVVAPVAVTAPVDTSTSTTTTTINTPTIAPVAAPGRDALPPYYPKKDKVSKAPDATKAPHKTKVPTIAPTPVSITRFLTVRTAFISSIIISFVIGLCYVGTYFGRHQNEYGEVGGEVEAGQTYGSINT